MYARYGGVYISAALVWLWVVDGIRSSRTELTGVEVCLARMAVIPFGGPDSIDGFSGSAIEIRYFARSAPASLSTFARRKSYTHRKRLRSRLIGLRTLESAVELHRFTRHVKEWQTDIA
jgi:hypothetical protein